MTPDEKNLVRAFQAGQVESFQTLYSQYGARIYRFCYGLCENRADAEDLTQEVFLAAFKGARRFEGRSSLTTWLYRIALYCWRKACNVRQPDVVSLDETYNVFSSDPARIGLENMLMEQALAALPEKLRIAFLLVKVEGLLCREAAEALDIPEGTLKSRVYAAVLRLQQLLEPEDSAVPAKHPESFRPIKEICDEM